MIIFLAILAFILLFGMIGDKEQQNRNNFTNAFIVVIIAILAMYVFSWGDEMLISFVLGSICGAFFMGFIVASGNEEREIEAYNEGLKAGEKNGRCEMDQDNNRHL